VIYSPERQAEARGHAPKVLLAQNLVNIEDGVIDRMRTVYSRDLIIEKVDETTPTRPRAPRRRRRVRGEPLEDGGSARGGGRHADSQVT